MDRNPRVREAYLNQIRRRIRSNNEKKAMRSLSIMRKSELKTLDKKKSEQFKQLLDSMGQKKLKGVTFKKKKLQRTDPALGSGDNIWNNEWDKIANYGIEPIKHLVKIFYLKNWKFSIFSF